MYGPELGVPDEVSFKGLECVEVIIAGLRSKYFEYEVCLGYDVWV